MNCCLWKGLLVNPKPPTETNNWPLAETTQKSSNGPWHRDAPIIHAPPVSSEVGGDKLTTS